MIYWQIKRIKEAKKIDKVIVATSQDVSDDPLVDFLFQNDTLVERGSIDDVLGRFLKVLERFSQCKNIVRLTADCPLVMPEIIDEMIMKFEKSDVDFLSNCIEPTFPDGLDVEILKRTALIRLNNSPLSPAEREHVTLGLLNRKSQFSVQNFSQETDLSSLRWTVDYEGDLEFVRRVYSEFEGRELTFNYQDVLDLLRRRPEFNNQVSGNLRNVALREIQE